LEPSYSWWPVFEAVRRLSIWVLGVLVILEGLYDDDIPVKSIILGMIMIGVLPLEDLLPWHKKHNKDRDAGNGS